MRWFYGAVLLCSRWVGDCTLVTTMAEVGWRLLSMPFNCDQLHLTLYFRAAGQTFVKQRMNSETNALESISIPDHIDILGKLACGEL